MASVAVLGIGLLGAGFARKLLEEGHEVVVWNRTASKTLPLVEAGATAAETPAAAVRGADRVHLVLTADAAVDAVIEAAREGLGAGVYVIDHSTNAPEGVAARAPALRAQGVRYVPAPVFMSPENARTATGLMLLVADDAEAAELTAILDTMTGRVWHVGDRPDLAAIYKICGNAVLIATAGLMGDLYSIGQAHDMTPGQVEALFDNFQLGAFFGRMGGRVRAASSMDTSFALTMARKDVGLMIDAAGGPDKLSVLPGLADAMDAEIEAGRGDADFAIVGWRDRPEA